MRIRAVFVTPPHSRAAVLQEKLYLLNHIVLYVENIDIVLAYTTRVPATGISSSASRMTPLTVEHHLPVDAS